MVDGFVMKMGRKIDLEKSLSERYLEIDLGIS
jgi:hypothetical protein